MTENGLTPKLTGRPCAVGVIVGFVSLDSCSCGWSGFSGGFVSTDWMSKPVFAVRRGFVSADCTFVFQNVPPCSAIFQLGGFVSPNSWCRPIAGATRFPPSIHYTNEKRKCFKESDRESKPPVGGDGLDPIVMRSRQRTGSSTVQTPTAKPASRNWRTTSAVSHGPSPTSTPSAPAVWAVLMILAGVGCHASNPFWAGSVSQSASYLEAGVLARRSRWRRS